MSGIIGADKETLSSQKHYSGSVGSNQQTSEPRKPGRPPKKETNNDDIRATFIISAELLRKIKYISLMEDLLQKDVVGMALFDYVSKWEQENGNIRLPKK